MINREVAWICVVFTIFDVCSCAVRQWGEVCSFSAECSDHRLVCVTGRLNVSKCECDRYHIWNGTSNGCVEAFDIETILNMTITTKDNQALLEKDQQHIYLGQKMAGLFVMTVAFLCPVVVAIHCFHMKRKDKILKNELKVIKERVESAKQKRTELTRAERIV